MPLHSVLSFRGGLNEISTWDNDVMNTANTLIHTPLGRTPNPYCFHRAIMANSRNQHKRYRSGESRYEYMLDLIECSTNEIQCIPVSWEEKKRRIVGYVKLPRKIVLISINPEKKKAP